MFQHGARIKENPTAKVTEVPKGDTDPAKACERRL